MTAGADWVDSARRLLDALVPQIDPAATGPAGTRAGSGPAHGADCRWCPVCQAAAVVRGERPDVTAALADVLATTASVLRDLAGEPDGSDAAPDADAADPDPDTADAGPGPVTVQRIDIA